MGSFRRYRIQLDAPADGQSHFYALGDPTQGPGASMRSVEQLARPITANHSLFGKVKLDRKTFDSFVKNFNDGTLGQDVQLDRAHNPNDGVNGRFVALSIDANGRLLGTVEWTPLGVKTFQQDGFKYLSIDFTDDYVNPETGTHHGPLLFGAALTPRPFIKNMTPSAGPGRLMLSEGRQVFVPAHLQFEESSMTFAEFLAALRTAVKARKLSEAAAATLLSTFESAGKLLSEDGDKLKALLTQAEAQIAQLSATPAPQPAPAINVEDIVARSTAAMQKLLDDRAAASKQLAATEASNRKLFTDAVNNEKGLTEDTRKTLLSQADLITGEMSADQVTRMAANAIKLGNEMEVRMKKALMGLQVAGHTGPIILDNSDLSSRAMQFSIDYFGRTSHRSWDTPLKLPTQKKLDELKHADFIRKTLAAFDQINAVQLDAEIRCLSSDGSVNIPDGNFPVLAIRQVIVELLADQRFFQLVNMLADMSNQATIQIPYEVRDTSKVVAGAVVYEGKPINYGGVTQRMDQAWSVPRKIALLITNEMMFYSRTAAINWDAMGRAVASNSRLLRDLVCAALANEMLRAADAYASVAVTNESLTSTVNGTRNRFKLANFPVVQPYTPTDLTGASKGSTVNPITVTLGGTALSMYDGTGTQSAGNYWAVADWNLGYLNIVNQAGAVQTPANATTLVVSYSYATNLQKFDVDMPSSFSTNSKDYPDYLNTLLNLIAAQKATLLDQRYVNMDENGYAICSNTTNQLITQASQYERNRAKEGTDLDPSGMVQRVKNIPFFASNQPGVFLGNNRILMGQSGQTAYGLTKPFAMGQPFEVMDPATMKPVGKKQAYGEEYSAIYTPPALYNRSTSILVYSSSGRAAA